MNEKKIQSQMISSMSKSSLKSGRLRNIFVMVTIFLSVSLLTVILLFGAGSGEETKRAVSHMQHASYYELDSKQMDALKADERISFYMETKSGITSELDGYSVTPHYVSRLSDKIQAGTLEEGKLPEQKNQAAVEAALLTRMGIEPRIGNIFEIEFYDGNVEIFEVSGILKGAKANKNHTLLLSREYAESGSQLTDEKYTLYVKISGAETMGKEECKEFIYQIGTDAGMEYKYINPTKAFLDSLSVDPNMLMLEIGVGMVILLACVLVIYGVFYISVIGRIHQFGQLRTLGMTKKQIKKLVKKEGSQLFVRAFPFGIVVGAAVGYMVKPDGWSFKNALLVSILVIAVNYMITMLSVLKPAKIASNISPMEALRYTTQEEMKKEGSKKECRKLTPSGLGFMNFSKNRKKTVITMLSLLLGGVLFMTAATYMSSFDKEQYSRQLDFKHGEFVIHIPVSAIELDENGLSGIQSNTPLSYELKNKIENIPGVKKIIRQGELGVKYDYEKGQEYGADDMVAPLTKEALKDIQKHVVEGEADLDKLTSGGYVLIRGNDVVEEIYGWKFAVGDKITLHYYDVQYFEYDEYAYYEYYYEETRACHA